MSALERFDEIEARCDAEDKLSLSPLERLRFFCSLAMSGQDWLDVEPFFQAVEALAIAGCDKRHAELRRVLRGLAANAGGALRAFEPETRAAIGNTNWQAIADYVAQADDVLGPNV